MATFIRFAGIRGAALAVITAISSVITSNSMAAVLGELQIFSATQQAFRARLDIHKSPSENLYRLRATVMGKQSGAREVELPAALATAPDGRKALYIYSDRLQLSELHGLSVVLKWASGEAQQAYVFNAKHARDGMVQTVRATVADAAADSPASRAVSSAAAREDSASAALSVVPARPEVPATPAAEEYIQPSEVEIIVGGQ